MSGSYALGSAAAGAATILWLVFLFWNPYRQTDSQGAVISVIMCVISLLALGAALLEAPVAMLLFGGVALVPVGLYLLLTPGIFAFIGVADIVVVLAGIWALWARYRRSTSEMVD